MKHIRSSYSKCLTCKRSSRNIVYPSISIYSSISICITTLTFLPICNVSFYTIFSHWKLMCLIWWNITFSYYWTIRKCWQISSKSRQSRCWINNCSIPIFSFKLNFYSILIPFSNIWRITRTNIIFIFR